VFPRSYDNASGGLTEQKNLLNTICKIFHCYLNLQKREKKVPQFLISELGAGESEGGYCVRAGSNRSEAQTLD